MPSIECCQGEAQSVGGDTKNSFFSSSMNHLLSEEERTDTVVVSMKKSETLNLMDYSNQGLAGRLQIQFRFEICLSYLDKMLDCCIEMVRTV